MFYHSEKNTHKPLCLKQKLQMLSALFLLEEKPQSGNSIHRHPETFLCYRDTVGNRKSVPVWGSRAPWPLYLCPFAPSQQSYFDSLFWIKLLAMCSCHQRPESGLKSSSVSSFLRNSQWVWPEPLSPTSTVAERVLKPETWYPLRIELAVLLFLTLCKGPGVPSLLSQVSGGF